MVWMVLMDQTDRQEKMDQTHHQDDNSQNLTGALSAHQHLKDRQVIQDQKDHLDNPDSVAQMALLVLKVHQVPKDHVAHQDQLDQPVYADLKVLLEQHVKYKDLQVQLVYQDRVDLQDHQAYRVVSVDQDHKDHVVKLALLVWMAELVLKV